MQSDDKLLINERIDMQHQSIFVHLERVAKAIAVGDPLPIRNAMHDLQRFTLLHFEEEEAIMTEVAYPFASGHAQLHRDFNRVFQQTIELSQNDIVIFTLLEKWFSGHILNDDMSFRTWFHQYSP